MKVTVIRYQELSSADLNLWSRLQRGCPDFANPFFCPQFTSAVSAVCHNVFISKLEENGRTVGFFPFQVEQDGVGIPVGGVLSDYHGVIIEKDIRWTAENLIRESHLKEWSFNHLIASQEQFDRYHTLKVVSPVLDLSRGFDSYVDDRHKAGSNVIKKLFYLKQRLEREAGPVHYEAHVEDRKRLYKLMECKSIQYRRSNKIDVFACLWVRGLIERIHSLQDRDFAGMLSILYAGDRPAAFHMGMRSGTVWHYWYPCYDRRFARYSPGLILLLEMAKSAESFGLDRIDLGRGEAPYKKRMMNHTIPIAEGAVPGKHQEDISHDRTKR